MGGPRFGRIEDFLVMKRTMESTAVPQRFTLTELFRWFEMRRLNHISYSYREELV